MYVKNEPRETNTDRRLDAAIAHLESVARVCKRKKGARVIPFPPTRPKYSSLSS